MSKKILFKAKSVFEGKEWIQGFYFYNHSTSTRYILNNTTQCVIKEETLSQYIGVKDAHNNRIFQNDILKNEINGEKYLIDTENKIDILKYHDEKTHKIITESIEELIDNPSDYEIIGNKFDNPEEIYDITSRFRLDIKLDIYDREEKCFTRHECYFNDKEKLKKWIDNTLDYKGPINE